MTHCSKIFALLIAEECILSTTSVSVNGSAQARASAPKTAALSSTVSMNQKWNPYQVLHPLRLSFQRRKKTMFAMCAAWDRGLESAGTSSLNVNLVKVVTFTLNASNIVREDISIWRQDGNAQPAGDDHPYFPFILSLMAVWFNQMRIINFLIMRFEPSLSLWIRLFCGCTFQLKRMECLLIQ